MESPASLDNASVTGRDIRLKTFRRTVFGRGFDPVEVDEYLVEIARSVDTLHAAAEHHARSTSAMSTSSATTGAALDASAMADARAQADAIVANARAEAARILAEAQDRARDAERLETAAALRAAELERQLARRAEGLLEEATRLQRAAADLGGHLAISPESEMPPTPSTAAPDAVDAAASPEPVHADRGVPERPADQEREAPLDVFELRRRARATS